MEWYIKLDDDKIIAVAIQDFLARNFFYYNYKNSKIDNVYIAIVRKKSGFGAIVEIDKKQFAFVKKYKAVSEGQFIKIIIKAEATQEKYPIARILQYAVPKKEQYIQLLLASNPIKQLLTLLNNDDNLFFKNNMQIMQFNNYVKKISLDNKTKIFPYKEIEENIDNVINTYLDYLKQSSYNFPKYKLTFYNTNAAILIDIDSAKKLTPERALAINKIAIDSVIKLIIGKNLAGLILVDILKIDNSKNQQLLTYVRQKIKQLNDENTNISSTNYINNNAVDIRALDITKAGILEIIRERHSFCVYDIKLNQLQN